MATIRIQKTKKRMRGTQYTQYVVTLPVRDVRKLGWDGGTTDLYTMRIGKRGILLQIANHGLPIKKATPRDYTIPLPF